MNLLARFHSMSIVWSLSAQGEWKWDLVKGDRSGRYALRFTSIDFQNCLMVDGEAYGYAIAKSMYGFEPFQIQHRIELVSSPEELVPERETSSTKDITECSNGSILRRAPTSRHLNWLATGYGQKHAAIEMKGVYSTSSKIQGKQDSNCRCILPYYPSQVTHDQETQNSQENICMSLRSIITSKSHPNPEPKGRDKE